MRLSAFAAAALCAAALSIPLGGFAAAAKKPATQHRVAAPNPQERSVVTHHQIVLGGKTVDYTATAGTLILKDEKGKPEASVFYVAYTRDGADRNKRPVTFLYNGGPGCASSPLHMAAFGPRRIVFSNADTTAGPGYHLTDNQYTLLDASDIVFIDAPGTGYSRLMPKVDPKTMYGIDQDAAAFGQFINRYVTLNDRWNSPKFLLGESYGTPRSAALVNYLQSNDSMAFNGVILLSSVLDFDTIAPGPGNDLAYVTFLPTEAAVHWYHDQSPNKGSLDAVVNEARAFANGLYASALVQGDRLPHDQFVKIAGEMAHLTGLSERYVEQANLRIVPERFAKELMRETGETVGRLDARYTGYDLDTLGDSAEYDPTDAYTAGGLQSGFLSYARNELNWKSDAKYPQCVESVNANWDYTRKSVFGWLAPTTSPDLQQAMTTNPRLRVFVGAGYFDMATPFGAAEWTFSHLGLHPNLRSHVTFGYYPSGHMVYLNVRSLEQFHADLDKFYEATLNQ
ncbi:MAG TPA: hypothetical protein VNF68_09490 [Candidatus Baltobacteraceae bacterium]|nr:hypothetical protein [Candidatus Baltobacteraceae bacterium]